MKPPTTPSRPTRAIVIGGSLAGLLTARVLSDHVDQVTLVERDPFTNEPEARKGQPQARHLHGLLAQGLWVMTRYFPDLPEALTDGGALVTDMAAMLRTFTRGSYRVRFASDLRGALVSRPFLEGLIRQRVVALPNVRVQDGCDVEGLALTEDRSRVAGVRLTRRADPTRTETLAADLVVDASGRGSQAPAWLAAAGFQRPAESVVKVRVGYTTRIYRRDPHAPGSREAIFIIPDTPRERRLGGAFPVEGDRWVVTLGGWHDDHAPLDEAGFLDYARSLPAPDVYHIVRDCEPLSKIFGYKFPASVRRHYEKLARLPQGFLVLGDAACSFNPLYGQGMTSAALQAAELDAVLCELGVGHGELARVFFKRAAKVVDTPWQMAVGADFVFAETEGPKAPGTDGINAYMARVDRATHHDPVVAEAFLRALNMIEPPSSLFHPRILWRVLGPKAIQRAPSPLPAAPSVGD